MLLRFLFTAVLIYFFFRAAGNLLRAVRGETGMPNRVPERENGIRFDIRPTPEARRSPSANPSPRPTEQQRKTGNDDIEDAKWTDVS